MTSFTTPSCIGNNNLVQSIVNPACPANLFPNTFLANTQAECATCNPFAFFDNPLLKEGCYKWAFKIQCNDENRLFVENPWNPANDCINSGITCPSIITGVKSLPPLKEGKLNCGCGCSKNLYRGYDIQGIFK